MTNDPVFTGIRPWAVAFTLISLASVCAFLQDIISPDWHAWVLSPVVILAFRGLVVATPQDSLARAALYQAAVLLVPFMAIYGLLDAAFRVDWPAWVFAPMVVLILWMGISTVAEAEAD